jgi:hypothetical protein
MKRKTLTHLGAGVACLALILGGTTAAQATLTGSTFEGNDGNLIHTGSGTDWDNVAGLNKGFDVQPGGSDNAFGQGTKEDNAAVTVVDGSIPPNKNDLSRFYEASELVAANGHTYLYLAWERLVNIGNANLDFEINQATTARFTGATTGPVTINRTAGDLLVTYDFSGSGTPTLGINTWLTAVAGNTTSQCFAANALPCWGRHASLGSASEGAVNTVGVTDPIAPVQAQLGAGLFGEASIDLTAAQVFPPGTCRAFGSAFIKSRSSSSFTAEIKDFIAPVPVQIANCGTITIHKVTENGDSTFNYATTGNIGTAGFTLSNGGQKQYTDVQPGTSSVTENLTAAQTTAGWTFKSLTCGTVSSGSSVVISAATVTITMGAGGNVDCTYTNHIKVSPTIATTLSATTVTVGDSVQDSATLTGATSTAGGTVTYTVYTDNTCTAGPRDAGTVNVTNGIVPDSTALAFNTAGDFYWQAVYSGDANNNGATSTCTSEHVVITKAKPGAATAQDLIPNDNFTLSGGFNPTGSITFNLYAPGDTTCLAPVLTQTVPVTDNATYSTTNTVYHSTTVGTWRWASSYTGDVNNEGASSACGVEQFTIANN